MGYLQVLYLIFFYCTRERIFVIKKFLKKIYEKNF